MTDTIAKPRPRARGDAHTFRRVVTVTSWLSNHLAAKIAMRVWRMTRRYPVPDREVNWLVTATTEYFPLGRRRICLRRWGDPARPTVLLVHGWAGRGSQMGAYVAPLLERGMSVIAPDLPGHGDSAGRSTDVLECAELLRKLSDHSRSFAGVIAHSFGAVAVSFAMNNGLRTDCCVLVGAPSIGERIFDGYVNWLSPPRPVVDHMYQQLRQRYGDNVFEILSPRVQATTLNKPCLILHDEEDRDVPIEAGIELALCWSGAELIRTKGLGHRRILRNTKSVQLAAEFVADTDSTSLSCSQSRHC